MSSNGSLNALYVDDDEIMLELVKFILEEDNIRTEICKNEKEAIELAESFKPDVLIIDYFLTQLTGIEVVKSLRLIEGFEKIPVVFLTASDDLSNLNQSDAEILSPYTVVKKPISGEEISNKITGFLSSVSNRHIA